MVNLLFAADENYLEPLEVALSSAFANTTDHAGKSTIETATIFYKGTPDRQLRQRFERCSAKPQQIRVLSSKEVPIDLTLPRPTYHSRISAVSYARLFPLLLAPCGATRLLYLDCDVLVRRNLTELFYADLAGLPVGAVRDAWTKAVSESGSGIRHWDALGLRPDTPYFNAGVLVMDLGAWERDGVDTAIAHYLERQQGSLELADQEILNAVLAGRIKDLDGRWNVVAKWNLADEPVLSSPDDVFLRHFVGRRKPWTLDGSKQPHAEEYFATKARLRGKD